jgi:hypothetical protein
MLKPVLGFILLSGLLIACKDSKKEKEKTEQAPASPGLSNLFKEAKLPYQLTDTGLANNKDTVSIPSHNIESLFPDSIKTSYFGKGAKIRYTPLAKFYQRSKETYYLVKATAGTKKGSFLLVFDNNNNYGATYPFLLPDSDPNTSQYSTLDKSYSLTKATTKRNGPEIIGEGKEVLAYDPAEKEFSLIMLDPLEDRIGTLVNPIDTFPRTNKLAGDYLLGKKNMVAVRDGRYPNQLLVYIHTDSNDGECIGEMKGEFIMTSSTTAAYRQAGDPCVLNLNFKGNSVSINEERGCGNYRGLDCPLSGTFTKKKATSVKPSSKKAKAK